MSTEKQEAGNERFYDEEIGPALAGLAARCHERGMSFLANVEYATEARGGTYFMAEGAGLQMVMLRLLAQCAPNVDSFLIALTRHCRENGIDISQSLFLNLRATT